MGRNAARVSAAVMLCVALASCGGGTSLPYTERFSGSCEHWSAKNDDTLKAGCVNGEYEVLVRRARNVQLFTVPITANAVRVEADVRVVAGPPPRRYGLGCFSGKDSIGNLTTYWAVLTPGTGYDIVDYQENAQAHAATAASLTTDRHAVSARTTYHLQADCASNLITMRVDHGKVFSAPNVASFAAGVAGEKPPAFKHVGFVVFPHGSGSDVRFDNFRAEKLSSSGVAG